MIYGIKCFGQIDCCDNSAFRFRFVKAVSYRCRKWEKGRSWGPTRAKTMLRVIQRKQFIEVRVNELLEYFRSRAEKADGLIRDPFIRRFAGFQNWQDDGAFPNRRESRLGNRQVKQLGEVCNR